jgi:hypothetical protein
MSCRVAGTALAFLLSFALARPSSAEEARSLTVATERCLEVSALHASLATSVGPGGLPPGVSARVVEREGRATVEIWQAGERVGLRVVDPGPEGCADLGRAVAVAIAVAAEGFRSVDEAVVGSETMVETSVAPSRAESPPAEPPLVAPVPPPTSAAPPDRGSKATPSSVRIASAIELGGALGITPNAAASASAMMELGYGPPTELGIEPELSGRVGMLGAASEVELEERPVRVGVVAGRTDLCAAAAGSAFRIRGCASGLLGALLTDGANDDLWLRAGGRIDAAWLPVREIGLTAAFDLLANFAPAYVLRTEADGTITDLEELGPASLIFSAGVLLPIP